MHQRGDNQVTRLGDRRRVQPSTICPDCQRAGFHAVSCSRPDQRVAPTRPATLAELRDLIRQARGQAA